MPRQTTVAFTRSGLMNIPSLEGIFAQLVEERDLESVAHEIVESIQTAGPV